MSLLNLTFEETGAPGGNLVSVNGRACKRNQTIPPGDQPCWKATVLSTRPSYLALHWTQCRSSVICCLVDWLIKSYFMNAKCTKTAKEITKPGNPFTKVHTQHIITMYCIYIYINISIFSSTEEKNQISC